MRIMACSCRSDSLVYHMYGNMDVWDASKERVREDSVYLMKDFHTDLYCASKQNNKKFFEFVSDHVSVEEWLYWFRHGAVLEEFVLILRNMPYGIAKKISVAVVTNYNEMMEGFYAVG